MIIVQRNEPVLREVAKEIPVKDITSPHIQKVILEMKEALASQDDGVALAAPQIGYSLSIFVVSGKAFVYNDHAGEIPQGEWDNIPPDMVFINPKITKLSKKQVIVPEGCLSVRWLYGKMVRAEKARVRAWNEIGKRFEYGGSGLIAQIFQHETDHLKGVLFIDNATDVQDMPPEGHPHHHVLSHQH